MKTKARVLYVEDDEAMRTLLREILENQGYEVETAVDGLDGLNHLRKDGASYGILITDILMPVMNGIELVKRLEHTAFNGPVIILSNFRPEEYEKETFGLQIAARLHKGNFDELTTTITRVLAEAQAD